MKIKHEIKEKLRVPIFRIIGTILSFGFIVIFHLLLKRWEEGVIEAYYSGILTLVVIALLIFAIWYEYEVEHKQVVVHKIAG